MENREIETPIIEEENIINNDKIINNKDYNKEYTLEYNNLAYKLKMIIDDNGILSFIII